MEIEQLERPSNLRQYVTLDPRRAPTKKGSTLGSAFFRARAIASPG
jgi:hypothetical protein